MLEPVVGNTRYYKNMLLTINENTSDLVINLSLDALYYIALYDIPLVKKLLKAIGRTRFSIAYVGQVTNVYGTNSMTSPIPVCIVRLIVENFKASTSEKFKKADSVLSKLSYREEDINSFVVPSMLDLPAEYKSLYHDV